MGLDNITQSALRSNADNYKDGRINTMASNTHNVMTTPNNSSAATNLCSRKRKFEEFATPPEREYYETPDEPEEQTVGQLIAAGSDLANIMSSTCQLTNPIHPIFESVNLCLCEYQNEIHCVAPRFAANPPAGVVKISPTPLPNRKNMLILRTILQLASQMITHPQTLPFWAGLIDAVIPDGGDKRAAFTVHPTRRLDPARTEQTLEALEKFKDNIRVHFKAFGDDDTSDGWIDFLDVKADDPAYKQGMDQQYAHRDGKATIDSSPPFVHMFINTMKSKCLLPYEEMKQMTISEMKVEMFDIARTIVHELSHTLDYYYCISGSEPRMNDELLIETGKSLENFLFGGTFTRIGCHTYVSQWPSQRAFDFYTSKGYDMELGFEVEPGQTVDLGRARDFPVETRKCAVFLEQSFWDDPKPPAGCWKKMWLRPHMELAINEKDFDHFNSFEEPYVPPLKRQQLSEAAMERMRGPKMRRQVRRTTRR
jgi:hypothetical protein